MNPPQHPIAETIATKLKDAFQSGRLEHFLPGERELASTYNVGRGTIRSALSVLEREGYITEAEARLPRRIILPSSCQNTTEKSSPYEKNASVGFLTSVPISRMPQGILAELHLLRGLLEQNGWNFQIHETPWSIGSNPENRLARLDAKSGHSCWILYRASNETQKWFKKQHIPCILRGTSYPVSGLPCLDTNWTATANHAAAHLWNKGHRTVGLCLPEEKLKGHQLVKKNIFNFKAEGWNPITIPFSSAASSTFDNLEQAYAAHPDITAFITMRGNQIITLFSWAAGHALAIPEQISLINLNYEPILSHLHPPVAGYEINAEKSVRRLARMIRLLLASRNTSSAFVIPEFNQGQSISVLSGPAN